MSFFHLFYEWMNECCYDFATIFPSFPSFWMLIWLCNHVTTLFYLSLNSKFQPLCLCCLCNFLFLFFFFSFHMGGESFFFFIWIVWRIQMPMPFIHFSIYYTRTIAYLHWWKSGPQRKREWIWGDFHPLPWKSAT